jgi:L-threonylcarbamoyladenylate synthase
VTQPFEVLEVDPSRPDQTGEALDRAVRALASGEIVVVPTETVYGLAARPDMPGATARVFEAKRRPGELTLPVLAADQERAWALARPEASARRLARAFWPGPLTMVLPRTERSKPWHLGERAGSIGVRVPDHPITRGLLELAGPLAATSANVSGRPPIRDPEAIVATFGAAVAVYLVLPRGAPPPAGSPSTVVDLTRGEVRVLRPGAVDDAALRRALAGGAVGPAARPGDPARSRNG